MPSYLLRQAIAPCAPACRSSKPASRNRVQCVCSGRQYSLPERAALAATAVALAAALGAHPAMAAAPEPVYFGNGCFWGRQYDFVKAEETALGRKPGELSAVVGYAGGKLTSPSGRACYYYTPDKASVYERLGHAEVVQVELRGDSTDEEAAQFKALADTYFSQFRRLPNGKMQRQDPQDSGPGYRNVVGIPGGVDSPLFPILERANVNGMRLARGEGGAFDPDGAPTEGDELNTVWVVDSRVLGFNRAELYHQFHDGLGKSFPARYKRELRQKALEAGVIAPSEGCTELFFLGS